MGFFLETKICLMKLVAEKPTISQNFWKKIGSKPSELGAFKGLKERIASLISELVMLWIRRLWIRRLCVVRGIEGEF